MHTPLPKVVLPLRFIRELIARKPSLGQQAEFILLFTLEAVQKQAQNGV